MAEVTIITSPNCSYCHTAKVLLQQHGITYQEVDLIKQHEQAQPLLAQSGYHQTVPQIFINQQFIGGFTELSQQINDNPSNLIAPFAGEEKCLQ